MMSSSPSGVKRFPKQEPLAPQLASQQQQQQQQLQQQQQRQQQQQQLLPAQGLAANFQPAFQANIAPAANIAPTATITPTKASPSKKRKTMDLGQSSAVGGAQIPDSAIDPSITGQSADTGGGEAAANPPSAKKARTNTPWTPAEEKRLKQMRDAGNTWSEIAKTFPNRTEGSVKKHWYKDMHYADFAEDESAALLAAIKEYDANKWKVIGTKVGKPAKACEQYAKENFAGRV